MTTTEVGVTNTPGSNFWRGPNRITGEHDFQSRKTWDLNWRLLILTASTPAEAKRLGRKAPLREDWEQVKYDEMRDVVLRKALCEPDFVDWLLGTGDAVLIEYNTWHDNEWGVCECQNCIAYGRVGKNMLGDVLMEIRELIRSHGDDPS